MITLLLLSFEHGYMYKIILKLLQINKAFWLTFKKLTLIGHYGLLRNTCDFALSIMND